MDFDDDLLEGLDEFDDPFAGDGFEDFDEEAGPSPIFLIAGGLITATFLVLLVITILLVSSGGIENLDDDNTATAAVATNESVEMQLNATRTIIAFEERTGTKSSQETQIASVLTASSVVTRTFTPSPSNTFGPSPTFTFTPTPTFTFTPSPSNTFGPSPTFTFTPTPSNTFTPTPTFTFTPTPTYTPSDYMSPTPNFTATLEAAYATLRNEVEFDIYNNLTNTATLWTQTPTSTFTITPTPNIRASIDSLNTIAYETERSLTGTVISLPSTSMPTSTFTLTSTFTPIPLQATSTDLFGETLGSGHFWFYSTELEVYEHEQFRVIVDIHIDPNQPLPQVVARTAVTTPSITPTSITGMPPTTRPSPTPTETIEVTPFSTKSSTSLYVIMEFDLECPNDFSGCGTQRMIITPVGDRVSWLVTAGEAQKVDLTLRIYVRQFSNAQALKIIEREYVPINVREKPIVLGVTATTLEIIALLMVIVGSIAGGILWLWGKRTFVEYIKETYAEFYVWLRLARHKQSETMFELSIYISFVHGDSLFSPKFVRNYVTRHFEGSHIYRDTNKLNYGTSLKEKLHVDVRQCDAMIVVIGKSWLNKMDEYVLNEISIALERLMKVVIVPVDGAKVPLAGLPASIKGLAECEIIRSGNLHDRIHRAFDEIKNWELYKGSFVSDSESDIRH